jgi:glycosyltransferase involved in cell wall biosynthesis
LFLSSYPPQQCGIATFTQDLASAVRARAGSRSVSIAAVAPSPSDLEFPNDVAITIDRNDRESFRRAAEIVNGSHYDVVSVQHEFGLFGGPEGSYLLDLLHAVRKPIVTTLHTVLAEPSEQYRGALIDVVNASDAIVVLTPSATRLLHGVYGVRNSRICCIPHGIPDIPFVAPAKYQERLGFQGRTVLMTFGLLGPNKGIEDMIDALPEIVRRHPEVLYVIVGATHPGVRAHSGESYRDSLVRKVEQLHLTDHVIFHDRYLGNEELHEYLKACDIYVTPYPHREQISSGTLAYAVGMGKAVVSTKFIYAEDLLANGRGELVDIRSPKELARAINYLIENEEARYEMRWKAYQQGRKMIWPQVAVDYLRLIGELADPMVEPEPVRIRTALRVLPQPATSKALEISRVTG